MGSSENPDLNTCSLSCASCDWQGEMLRDLLTSQMHIHPQRILPKNILQSCLLPVSRKKSDHTIYFNQIFRRLSILKKCSQNGINMIKNIWIPAHWHWRMRLTFMLISPDSPQLSLGETDEENSTKPHVQLTLLPPSLSRYQSLLLLLFPCFPLTSLEVTGRLTPPLPCLSSLSLFASALPHNFFFLTSAKVYCFCLPAVSVVSSSLL